MLANKHDRRAFCVGACQALTAATVGSLVPACSSPTAPSSTISLPNQGATIVDNTVVVIIDPASPLASPAGAALVQTPSDSYLVTRTSLNAFSAVTAICTHFGCIISGYDNQNYVCPCHGSQFNTAGAVVKGPASQPLRQFTTEFANSTLTIRL
jgi:cytochrome b6-f complex iron-sulfur subunit